MPIIVFSAYFDHELEHDVYRLLKRIAERGLQVPSFEGNRPHISLAAYEVDDIASYQTKLNDFAQTRHPFAIRLHYLGFFLAESVVFAAPRITHALFTLHREVLLAFAGPGQPPLKFENNLGYDNWTPHCTLVAGVTPEKLAAVVEVCQQDWHPLCGTVEGINIVILPEKLEMSRHPFGQAA